MENVTSSSFLSLIRKHVKFSDYIIVNYPEIEADIRSYRTDPNCSCKHKIAKFFDANKDKLIANIQTWSNDNQTELKNTVTESTFNHRNVLKPTLPSSEWGKYKDVIGEIVEIAPDPNEYKRIIGIAREEWLYNGINILETVKFDPQTKQEAVVWLLLFY